MQLLKKLNKGYISTISFILWKLETIFFYPKLRLFYNNIFSKNPLEFQLSGRGMLIFDVGANKGQSIKFFKSMNPLATIYSFEPSPSTFAKLTRNLQARAFENVFLNMISLSSKKTQLELYESVLDETSSFEKPKSDSKYFKIKNRILFQSSLTQTKSIPVSVDTLDSFCAEHLILKISILKVDVEGHELAVIQGATRMLKNNDIAVVQFEKHEDDMRVDQSNEIAKFLVDFGYRSACSIKHPFGNFHEEIFVLQSLIS